MIKDIKTYNCKEQKISAIVGQKGIVYVYLAKIVKFGV